MHTSSSYRRNPSEQYGVPQSARDHYRNDPYAANVAAAQRRMFQYGSSSVRPSLNGVSPNGSSHSLNSNRKAWTPARILRTLYWFVFFPCLILTAFRSVSQISKLLSGSDNSKKSSTTTKNGMKGKYGTAGSTYDSKKKLYGSSPLSAGTTRHNPNSLARYSPQNRGVIAANGGRSGLWSGLGGLGAAGSAYGAAASPTQPPKPTHPIFLAHLRDDRKLLEERAALMGAPQPYGGHEWDLATSHEGQQVQFVEPFLPPPRIDDASNSTTRLAVFVLSSSSENFMKRQAIRETWAKRAGDKAQVFFVIGHSNCDVDAEMDDTIDDMPIESIPGFEALQKAIGLGTEEDEDEEEEAKVEVEEYNDDVPRIIKPENSMEMSKVGVGLGADPIDPTHRFLLEEFDHAQEEAQMKHSAKKSVPEKHETVPGTLTEKDIDLIHQQQKQQGNADGTLPESSNVNVDVDKPQITIEENVEQEAEKGTKKLKKAKQGGGGGDKKPKGGKKKGDKKHPKNSANEHGDLKVHDGVDNAHSPPKHEDHDKKSTKVHGEKSHDTESIHHHESHNLSNERPSTLEGAKRSTKDKSKKHAEKSHHAGLIDQHSHEAESIIKQSPAHTEHSKKSPKTESDIQLQHGAPSLTAHSPSILDHTPSGSQVTALQGSESQGVGQMGADSVSNREHFPSPADDPHGSREVDLARIAESNLAANPTVNRMETIPSSDINDSHKSPLSIPVMIASDVFDSNGNNNVVGQASTSVLGGLDNPSPLKQTASLEMQQPADTESNVESVGSTASEVLLSQVQNSEEVQRASRYDVETVADEAIPGEQAAQNGEEEVTSTVSNPMEDSAKQWKQKSSDEAVLPSEPVKKVKKQKRKKMAKAWAECVQQDHAFLMQEQLEYQDLLEIPMVDGYKLLPEKVLQSYKWAMQHLPNVEWLVKADDDQFLRVQSLDKYLRKYNHDIPMIVGRVVPHSKVAHEGKWREKDYDEEHYPWWPQGSAGHALSRKAAEYLAVESANLHRYQGEDVSIGIWMDQAHKEGHMEEEITFIQAKSMLTNQGTAMCGRKNVIMIGHQLNPEEMYYCQTKYGDALIEERAWVDGPAEFDIFDKSPWEADGSVDSDREPTTATE